MYEPGVNWAQIETDDEPRFTLRVTGLFASAMRERALRPHVHSFKGRGGTKEGAVHESKTSNAQGRAVG